MFFSPFGSQKNSGERELYEQIFPKSVFLPVLQKMKLLKKFMLFWNWRKLLFK